ncbi:DinB family protein [Litoribacter populi]|uniref:DinB family protein n=1 Tax=Litoribacter populi TaxID=2598460 RepID=UPI001180DB29|nr:DinB family protein [Litoribacter populi]
MEILYNYRTVTQLITHILGGHAYKKLEDILDEIPFELIQINVPGVPYTFYDILEHMRIAQKDILDYCCSDNYQELRWPDDYWPKSNETITEEKWESIKDSFYQDRSKFNKWLSNHNQQLFTPIQRNENHNLLREALILIEHNSYHTGQLMLFTRILKFDKEKI